MTELIEKGKDKDKEKKKKKKKEKEKEKRKEKDKEKEDHLLNPHFLRIYKDKLHQLTLQRLDREALLHLILPNKQEIVQCTLNSP